MRNKKNLLKLAGNLLTVLAILLIIKKMADMDIDYSVLNHARSRMAVAAISVLYGIVILTIGWPWGNYVRMITGVKLFYPTVIFVMARANLLKYLPGNIFQYVGRNDLAVRENLKHSDVGLATFFEVITNLLAAGVLGFVFYFKGFVKIAGELRSLAGSTQIFIYGTLILIFAAVLFLLWKKKRDLMIRYFRILTDKRNWRVFLINFLFYVVNTLINAGLYAMTLIFVLGMRPGMSELHIIIGAFILSWIAGFIMLGAPGGIGIREFVMTFLVPQNVDPQMILLGLVVYRLINILGDILGFLFGCLLKKVSKG